MRAAVVCSLLSLVAAVPNSFNIIGSRDVPAVVATALGGCTTFPGYDDSKKSSVIFHIAADSTGTEIDGHKDVAFLTENADGKIAFGQLKISSDSDATAIDVKCVGRRLRAHVVSAEGNDKSTTSWEALVLSDSLPKYRTRGDNLEGYSHSDASGQAVEGIFIGSQGITTWIFSKSADGHYAVRLATEGAALATGEFKGFIKVVSA